MMLTQQRKIVSRSALLLRDQLRRPHHSCSLLPSASYCRCARQVHIDECSDGIELRNESATWRTRRRMVVTLPKRGLATKKNKTAFSSIFKKVEVIMKDAKAEQKLEESQLPNIFSQPTRRKCAKTASQSFKSTAILHNTSKKTVSPKSKKQQSSSARQPPSKELDPRFLELFKLPEISNDNENEQTSEMDPSWQQYSTLLEDQLFNRVRNPKWRRTHTSKLETDDVVGPVEAWLRLDQPAISIELPTLDRALRHEVDTPTASSFHSEFAEEIRLQRARFQDHMKFTDYQYSMAQGACVKLSCLCAQQALTLAPGVIWEKIKEAGITDQTVLSQIMYVASTFSAPSNPKKSSMYARLTGASVLDVIFAKKNDDELDDFDFGDGKIMASGNPPVTSGTSIYGDYKSDMAETDNCDDMVDMADEIATYHDLLHQPTEQSITIRLRLLAAQGKAKEAEALILCGEDAKIEMKLRSYTPILRLYLEHGDVFSALSLYKRMRQHASVQLDLETYTTLLAGLASRGCFQPGAAAVDVHKSVTTSSGPDLFDELAAEMAQDVIEISMASAKRLYNGFAKGFPGSNLENTTSFSPLRLSDKPALKNEVLVNRVSIDPVTCECPCSGVKLRLISLDEEQRQQLKSSLLSLARDRQRAFKQKLGDRLQKSRTTKADESLLKFCHWLDNRTGKPFTAIVDGANVGYYMQNFEGGGFSFHQIQFVVDSLEKLGERPLVILPHKYSLPYFAMTISVGGASTQFATEEETAIRNRLRSSGKLFVVPAGLLDDFFWIMASVCDQTTSRNGRDLSVAIDNPDGRWPGTRPVLISNDQMRDHKLGMLEPRLFRRWYSNCIVNYHFPGFRGAECENPEIGFSSPDSVSREIQGNATENSGMTWHFPIADTENEWLCVRIPVAPTPSIPP